MSNSCLKIIKDLVIFYVKTNYEEYLKSSSINKQRMIKYQVLLIVYIQKKKNKTQEKKDFSDKNDILTLNNQVKSNKREILVLDQMIEQNIEKQ